MLLPRILLSSCQDAWLLLPMPCTGVAPGHPYGYIASATNQEVLNLGMRPHSSPTGWNYKDLMSCKDPERGAPTCADLDVLVGKSELAFSSGNTIGYRMLTTDVDTANGLDMFPFDTYTVKGVVRVSVSPCTAAASDWPLPWLQMAASDAAWQQLQMPPSRC